MTELGQTTDPEALVPGSAQGLFDLAAAWRERATTASTIAAQAGGLAVPEGWEGAAANGFAHRRDQVAEGWAKTGELLTAAADAVEAFATTLGWAQQKAGDAIAMWETAQAQTAASMRAYRDAERRAGPLDIIPPYVDGGASAREDARSLLAYARSEVQAAGDTAASTLGGLSAPDVIQWQAVGAAALASAQTLGQMHWNAFVDIVNGTASVGNALIRNPDALLAILGGAGMVLGGGSMMGGGTLLSATGAGAVAGGPAIAGGAALAGAGAAAVGAGAAKVAADAMGAGGIMLMEKQRGVNRGDDRDDYGQFATKQDSKPWVNKEKQGLDAVEEELTVTVERKQARAYLEGSDQRRIYDGFFRNPDGTYTAVEVKSGNAIERYLRGAGNQKSFDDAITPQSPATATLNGERIVVTNVLVKVVK